MVFRVERQFVIHRNGAQLLYRRGAAWPDKLTLERERRL